MDQTSGYLPTIIVGGPGDDVIYGIKNGDELIDGGKGNNTIYAGTGNSIIYGGGAGANVIYGNATDTSQNARTPIGTVDILVGDGGDAAAANTAIGSTAPVSKQTDGIDTFYANYDSNILIGGNHQNTFFIDNAESSTHINLMWGRDAPSTYNFTNPEGEIGIVYEIYINNTTVSAIENLDLSTLANKLEHDGLLGSDEAFWFQHNINIIVNPTSQDKIVLDGHTLNGATYGQTLQLNGQNYYGYNDKDGYGFGGFYGVLEALSPVEQNNGLKIIGFTNGDFGITLSGSYSDQDLHANFVSEGNATGAEIDPGLFSYNTKQTIDTNGNEVSTGTTGADQLSGSASAETFDGKGAPVGSQDYEQGNGGSNIFVFNQGYGQLEINELGSSSTTSDLQLGAGIIPAQVTITSDSLGNVFLTDGTVDDQVKLDGELNGSYQGVQSVHFADGASLSVAQLTAASSQSRSPTATTGILTIGRGETASLTNLLQELVIPGRTNDTETITAVGATNGQASLNAGTGAISYVAPAGGNDTVSYTVADQLGNTATGTVGVSVDPGPIAAAGSLTVGHGKTTSLTSLVQGLITAGLAGDTETVTAVSALNGQASLNANTGAISYIAPASGSDTVSYTVADQLGDTTTGTIGVSVNPGPTTATGNLTVGHGKTTSLTSLVDSLVTPGIAGNVEAIAALSATTGQTSLNLSTGAISYVAPASGSDVLTYTVADQLGDTATGTIGVSVNPGPVAATGGLTVGHGRTADLTSLVNGLVTPGLAGDTETITAVSATSGQASLNAGTGMISYTAPASGSDTVTYAVADQLGDAATGTVNVTVDPGPTAGALSRTTPLGSSVNLTSAILGAATPGLQGDTLAITGDGTAGTLGTVSLVNGQLTYTASGSGLQDVPQNGTMSDSFAYTVSDQYGDAASGTVSLTVTNPTPKLLTTSSGGSLQDAAGNAWTLTAGGDVDENGTAVPGGSNTAQLTIANNTEYGLDAQGSGWYAYSPAAQSWASSAPPPGLYPPTSLKGLTPGSGGALKDAAGNTWTLTSDGDVDENGTPVPGGSNTAGFTIFNNAEYGLDASGTGWYTYAPSTQTWTSAAAPAIAIPQSTTSATISMSSVLVSAAAGNRTLFVGGSNNTLTLAGGTETITDLGGANTYVVPAAGKGYDAFTTDVLNLNDVLDLRPALKATNWTGTASSLSKYLSVADSSQGATLSISATSGGAKTAIALIGGATTTNLSTLLTHAITK